jgi:hypothetical protein
MPPASSNSFLRTAKPAAGLPFLPIPFAGVISLDGVAWGEGSAGRGAANDSGDSVSVNSIPVETEAADVAEIMDVLIAAVVAGSGCRRPAEIDKDVTSGGRESELFFNAG